MPIARRLAMEVLVITILVSVLLAGGFVGFFIYLQKNPYSDPDRDSLLPLDEEKTVPSAPRAKAPKDKTETL